jgi:hypothetical protein
MDKIRADLIGDAGDLPRASFVSFLEALLAEGEDPAADPSHPHPHPQSHPSHTPGPCGEDGTATPMGISRRVWVLESARAHCPSSLYCRAFLGLWGQAADVPTILSPGAGGRSGRSRRKHPPGTCGCLGGSCCVCVCGCGVYACAYVRVCACAYVGVAYVGVAYVCVVGCPYVISSICLPVHGTVSGFGTSVCSCGRELRVSWLVAYLSVWSRAGSHVCTPQCPLCPGTTHPLRFTWTP